MINYIVTLKRLKKYIIYILLTTVLALAMIFVFTATDTFNYKETIQVLDEAKTPESKALIDYLNDTYQVSLVEDEVSNNNTLVIDKDFSEAIKKPEPLTLNYYGSIDDETIKDRLEEFISRYHGIIVSGHSLESIQNDLNTGRENVQLTQTNGGIELKNPLYFNIYLLVQLTIPISVTLFNNKKRSNVMVRQRLANKNTARDRIMEFLAIITFLIIPIITINISSILINNNALKVLPLAIGTQVLAVIGALVLGYLASAIARTNAVANILAIVIPLVIGFSSGSWFPFDFLDGALRTIGYLFPMYWINNITYNVFNGDPFTFELFMVIVLTVFYFVLATLFEKLNRSNQVHTEIE